MSYSPQLTDPTHDLCPQASQGRDGWSWAKRKDGWSWAK